jgi:hypothetical protein
MDETVQLRPTAASAEAVAEEGLTVTPKVLK